MKYAGLVTLVAGTVPCTEPPPGFPKYCCEGSMAVATYKDTCECNPDWNSKECSCRGVLLRRPCLACTVHLPETNRWDTAFHKDDLLNNCQDCVGRCRAELEKGMCAEFVSGVFEDKFREGSEADVICSAAHLQSHLDDETLDPELKRTIVWPKKLRADEDVIQAAYGVKGVR